MLSKLSNFRTTLINDSSITSLVGTYLNNPAIHFGNIPEKDESDTLINYYTVGVFRSNANYEPITVVVNCRSKYMGTVYDLAEKVFDATNLCTTNGTYMIASIGSLIYPQNESDDFNIPITIQLI